jgi:hypothetical protein
MVASPSPVILCSQAFCSRSPRAAARSIPPGRHRAAALRVRLIGIRNSGYTGGTLDRRLQRGNR